MSQVQDQRVHANLGLPDDAAGVLPSQTLARALEQGLIRAPDEIPARNVQPASVDLRLGEVAYRIRSSFLPDDRPVMDKLKELTVSTLDLREQDAVLETNCPYLIPLMETLHLPPGIRGKANPKSSTGRLDVFTRVITDGSPRFDEIGSGYRGPLYLEVVPLSFTVKVRMGLTLNQLRLSIGSTAVSDDELKDLHKREPILFQGSSDPVPDEGFHTSQGLFLSLDLQGDKSGAVGYRARKYTAPINMSQPGAHNPRRYWEQVIRETRAAIILEPAAFYLLLSREAVRIPPNYAAEMTAYDPTSGELRTHYAGFFDPGFGHDPHGEFAGSRAALEVRAHDVPFMIEHGQRVCKLTFERMAEAPSRLYGAAIDSTYQRQIDTLGKHFTRWRREKPPEGPTLFEPPVER